MEILLLGLRDTVFYLKNLQRNPKVCFYAAKKYSVKVFHE